MTNVINEKFVKSFGVEEVVKECREERRRWHGQLVMFYEIKITWLRQS